MLAQATAASGRVSTRRWNCVLVRAPLLACVLLLASGTGAASPDAPVAVPDAPVVGQNGDPRAPAAAGPAAITRTVLALYSSAEGQVPRGSRVHMIAQMPINHLGFHVRFHDVRDGPPEPGALDGVRAVMSWFTSSEDIPDGPGFIAWLERVRARGVRYLVFGHPGFDISAEGGQRVLSDLGIAWSGELARVTFDAQYIPRRTTGIGFERELTRPMLAFPIVRPVGEQASVWLSVQSGGGRLSDVVFTTPFGGFAANGFALFMDASSEERQIRAWLIDPFAFFQEALGAGEMPVPDVTTRAGRRIYYSHIDGDGWLNRTRIERYATGGPPVYASRVVLEEVIRANPAWPVTVAPIGAELDLDWHGTREARAIARALFELPNVEPASHTYTHPFAWGFFDGPDHRARERRYFDRYPGADRLVGVLGRIRGALGLQQGDGAFAGVEGYQIYERPRAFALEPFDMRQEIEGTNCLLRELAPEGTRIGLFQWSGNTRPSATALAAVAASGMANINGGDSRFDPTFPSYAWTAPIGIDVAGQWQVFASNSNENTYTENWSERFFGFKYLIPTLQNTNRPRRTAAFNLYYHTYSGARQAALDAVAQNLDYAKTRPLIPLKASTYARIAGSFPDIAITAAGPRRWRIQNRGHLQTLRFERGLFSAVDFDRSHGVMGQTRRYGHLYVALDPAVRDPVVALRASDDPDAAPEAPVAYLIESGWDVSSLVRLDDGVMFSAGGFADGAMRWFMPPPGDGDNEVAYRLRVRTRDGDTRTHRVTADRTGVLSFALGALVDGPWPKGPVQVAITRGDAP